VVARLGPPDPVQFPGLENARFAVDGHAGDSALIVFLKLNKRFCESGSKDEKASLPLW
jgi:hypothetical protein